MKCCFSIFTHVFAVLAVLWVTEKSLEATVFTVNSSQSHITLSGRIHGTVFSEQSSGSLTTTYQGFLNINLSAGTILFTGSGAVPAANNGSWIPLPGGGGGNAPANYGAKGFSFGNPIYGAGRNIVLDINSTTIPITSTNFDSSKVNIYLPTNGPAAFDYADLTGSGSMALQGTSTNAVSNSSIITNNNLVQLTIQIDTTINGANNTVLHLVGALILTNSLSALSPPIITSVRTATNNNFILTVSNAVPPVQLQSSSNMVNWSPAVATSNVINGLTIFTSPVAGQGLFFRVQK